MNLPAALEDLSGKEMPVSLIEKGGDVRTKGGIMQLRQLFDELPLLLQRNEEILRSLYLIYGSLRNIIRKSVCV